ncbi:MAG TPA: hypothetical protein VFS21_40105 [Roseiflexaceae bacterium]|nr:hypothetical protein [Roseiflexaceae bacterium]
MRGAPADRHGLVAGTAWKISTADELPQRRRHASPPVGARSHRTAALSEQAPAP